MNYLGVDTYTLMEIQHRCAVIFSTILLAIWYVGVLNEKKMTCPTPDSFLMSDTHSHTLNNIIIYDCLYSQCITRVQRSHRTIPKTRKANTYPTPVIYYGGGGFPHQSVR